METLKEYLNPKPFSQYGYIVAVSNLLAGFIVGIITSIRKTERRHFNCETDKDFLTTKCFNQYEQDFNSSLPLFGFAFLTFGSLVVVCIIYAWCLAKSRVEKIELHCTAVTPDNPQPIPIKTQRIFVYYLLQLLIRFGLGIFFASLQLTGLYASNFPSKFHCRTNPKGTSISTVNFNGTSSNSSVFLDCRNSFAREKTNWSKSIWILHIILTLLVLLEALCIFAKACRNKTIMRDSEFCQRHLFNNVRIPLSQMDFALEMHRILIETQYLEPLLPPDPFGGEKKRSIDDVYVDLIIHSGRVTHDFDSSKNRHELLEVYLKAPKASAIHNIKDLFVSKDKSYKNILIVGRPGIGKTSLCTKIIRDWCKGEIKQFNCVFLFKFRHLYADRFKKMSLVQFLNESEHSGNIDPIVFTNINCNPESVLLIFDGFDEYKHRKYVVKDQTEFSGLNGCTNEMPATALYAKLLQGKLLSGATIMTTSRPNAVNSLGMLDESVDRVAEILGFTPKKVKLYVEHFCGKDNIATARMIWQHIQSNINLLYLCYIPVTCRIVCSFLEDFIQNHNDKDSFILPTTLTDIYKGALKLFLPKHNPEYRQQQTASNDSHPHGFSGEIEEELSKLGSLARKGIEENRLVFEKEEVQQLENCGLLNCMPSKETPEFGSPRASKYCFIHLTLQEFLAARKITKKCDMGKISKFISSKGNDAAWHLVIQFIAGLLQEHAFQISTCFENLLFESLKNGCSNVTLLMFKCFYELSNREVAVAAAEKLVSIDGFRNRIDCSDSNVTPPDCTAIVYVLRHCGAGLNSLDISRNKSFGDHGCSELMKMFNGDSCTRHLVELRLEGNQIADQGVSCMSDALKSGNCHLTKLTLGGNKIGNKGVSYLSNALKSGNCYLTWLDLGFNQITDQGVSYLSGALKSGNCHLTDLYLGGNKIADQGASYLSNALKSVNCRLTKLHLGGNQIADGGAIHLAGALKSRNCRLAELYLTSNQITSKGATYLKDKARKSGIFNLYLDLNFA